MELLEFNGVHTFSLDYFHGSVTHITGRHAHTIAEGSYLVDVFCHDACD